MGLKESSSSLLKISEDINLRCDPIHTISFKKYEELKPSSDISNCHLVNALEQISNGINLSANTYSLNQTNNIYISVKEFNEGMPLIFNKNGSFKELITFLNEDIEDSLPDEFSKGLIMLDEIIVARSGAVGKIAWFGEFIKENPELNLIASGFTTKLKIKENYDPRFLSLWLNLPFVKYYIIAKSSGKCQRNISQSYLYEIPFPMADKKTQEKLAEKYYRSITKIKKEISSIPSNKNIIDEILSTILNLDLNFNGIAGIQESKDDLLKISERYGLRCDAKQEQEYLTIIKKTFEVIENSDFGDYFDSTFSKGKQPKYLQDQSVDGIPVISTLSIQDGSLIEEACKKISIEDYENTPEEIKPKKNDILITLDGIVSVGKPLIFEKEDEYGIDSHVGIVRIKKRFDSKILSRILLSELCQAQFRLFESGSTSHSINEIELRRIKIPVLNMDQIKDFNTLYDKKLKNIESIISRSKEQEEKIYESFLEELKLAMKN